MAARFAQRAVSDFFAGSARREFLIDAATAVEFMAKAVIAQHDPVALFTSGSSPLSKDELALLDPPPDHERTPDVDADREAALASVLARQTLRGREAVQVAASLAAKDNDIIVDVSAARRLFDARNRAIHIGDVDEPQIDGHAKDFLRVFEALTTAAHEIPQVMFGDLYSIADQRHMAVGRSPSVDVRVQVTLAKNRFHYGVVSPARRSRLPVAGDTISCPACRCQAHVTDQPPQSAPPERITGAEFDSTSRTLDCLFCGLTLYGQRQITRAQREFPPTSPV